MEEYNTFSREQRFNRFWDLIRNRVNDIGTRRGTTQTSVNLVIKALFVSFNGDASKITDKNIWKEFDAVDRK